MRSSTSLSSLALLATSLLAKEALAIPGRYDARKRGLVTDEVIVSEAVNVIYEGDDVWVTEAPVIVGTKTIEVTVVDSSTVAPVPVISSTVAPVPVVSTTTEAPAPVVSTTTVAPAPVVSSSSAPAVVSTVAAAAVAAAAAPVKAALAAADPVTTTTAVPTTTQAPATTTTATTSSAPVSTVSSTLKRGLAYNDITLLSGFVGTGSQSSWCYNWGAGPQGTVPTGLEYVPMLWGLGSSSTQAWDSAVTSALSDGSTHLLAFNEPDLSSQSNISPADAAAGYETYMQPYAAQAKLGSPAITNGPASSGMGVGWLADFVSDCSSCTIDFVAIHWYGEATNVADFQQHVADAYAAGGNRPLWITEFAASGSDEEEQAFLATMIPWLDAQDTVERYAYFMVSTGSLISTGTTLSALGKAFAFDY